MTNILNELGDTLVCPSCGIPCATVFELDNNDECDSCRRTRKVIIAGGRDFTDYELLKASCDKILSTLHNVEIVSGCANGADLLGEKYAEERGYHITLFPADWSLGVKAGPLRNKTMSAYSEYLIVFWDGKSRGSANMIATARKDGLKIRIIKY